MKPTSPVIEGRESEEIRLAENQPEFQTLPTLYFEDAEGLKALSRWEFESEDERAEFLRTGSIFVGQITGGRSPNPILPMVFAPEVPPATVGSLTSQAASAAPATAVLFEFRVVPLDRETGNPALTINEAAHLYANLTSFALVMKLVSEGASKPADEFLADAQNLIDLQAESLARILATEYGADVYFRAVAAGGERWQVVAGKLATGAHERRIVSPTNAGLPRFDAVFMDGDSATASETVRLLKMIRETFSPPYSLHGFAWATSLGVLHAFEPSVRARRFETIPAVFDFFREAMRPGARGFVLSVGAARGDFDNGSKADACFALDSSLFDKSRSY